MTSFDLPTNYVDDPEALLKRTKAKLKKVLALESEDVAPGFKNKTRYTPYVSPGSQISHIATNKGNIKRQCSIYNIV